MAQPEVITSFDYRIRRSLLFLLKMVNIGAVLVLAYYARPAISFVLNIISPFAVAMIIAYIFNPLVTYLQRRHRVGRLPAVVLVYSAIVLITAAFFAILVPVLFIQLRDSINQIIRLFPEKLQTLTTWLQLNISEEEIRSIQKAVSGQVDKVDWATVASKAGPAVSLIGQGAANAAAFLGALLAKSVVYLLGFFVFVGFVVVITFYFLLDFSRIRYVVRVLMPDEREPRFFEIWNKVDHALSGFLRGQLIVCVIIATLYTIALMLLGLKSYAILIGFLAGFGNLIPYFGPIIGGVPTALWVLFGDQYNTAEEKWLGIGMVVALSTSIQAIDGLFLQPRIVGRSAELHPLLVLLALLIGAQFGFGGLVLAVPIAVVVRVLLRELWWHPLVKRATSATPPAEENA